MPENRILRRKYDRLRKAHDEGDTALAVLRARDFLTDYPDYGPAWIILGMALVSLARYQEAEAALNRAMELAPSDKQRLPLYQLGHLDRERGVFDRAADWYRRSIEAAPDDASGYIYLGGALAKQGRIREAEAAHWKGIRCPDGCVDEAYLNLGLVLRAQERFEEAAECFRKAIDLDPDYKEAKRALRDAERCIIWVEGVK